MDEPDFQVVRYNANGTLDLSFHADIVVSLTAARNVVLQPNGAIVASGEPIGTSTRTFIARYHPNGGLAASFGVEGRLTLSDMRVGEGLALQGDGKLVLVGSIGDVPSTRFAVRRLQADGSPDTTFGAGGTVTTDLTGRGDAANAVALQGDGKIVVAGISNRQGNFDFGLARYNIDGPLDTTFAGIGGGKLTIDFFRFDDIGESVAVQPDGKIVIGGLARNLVDGYGVARVFP